MLFILFDLFRGFASGTSIIRGHQIKTVLELDGIGWTDGRNKVATKTIKGFIPTTAGRIQIIKEIKGRITSLNFSEGHVSTDVTGKDVVVTITWEHSQSSKFSGKDLQLKAAGWKIES